mgnify:CR=1 FL=1
MDSVENNINLLVSELKKSQIPRSEEHTSELQSH